MDLSRIDRNRMTVAIVATIILFPLMFIATGRSADSVSTTVVDATTTTFDLGLASDNTVDAPPNLEGPTNADPQGQGQIAYPADNDGQLVRTTASFKRLPDSTKNGCATPLIPLGATITVLNLNNGHKTKCVNINIGPTSGSFGIVLNTAVFESIAELIDAPLAVELTW